MTARVLLLSTYELGHSPMGLALPVAFLAREGLEVRAIDLAIEPLDLPAVRAARFVGISVPMHTALRLGLAAAARVRSVNPSCTLCFFGLYAPLHRELLLAEGATVILGGELEEDLVQAVRQSLAEEEQGTCAPAPILRRIDFPVPAREGLPDGRRYARLLIAGEERVAGQTEASRGCLHRCRHCPVPAVYDGRFFVVPREVVLEDVRRQVDGGARHITFGDPDFLNGPGHAMAIVRALHERHPEVSFDVTAKVEHLLRHRALLPELAAAGCAFVVTALESLSDVVLKALEKGHTRAQAFELFDLMDAVGLALRPSLLPFTPWSTIDDYRELLEVIAARDLVEHVDAVQLTIRLLLPPGSLVLSAFGDAAWLEPFDRRTLAYRWRHPDPRMDALHREVDAIARRAAGSGESAPTTFDRIRAAAGLRPRPARERARSTPPRLSEPWFCCAEPLQDPDEIDQRF